MATTQRRKCWLTGTCGPLAVAGLWLCLSARADLFVAPHPNIGSARYMPQGRLFLLGTPGDSGRVASRSGAFSQDFTLDAAGAATIAVPASQFLGPSGALSDQALRVSGARVSGYFLNQVAGSADMSRVFDEAVLGTRYRVLAYSPPYPQLPAARAQMSVTAVRDGTAVTVTPSVALDSGQPAHAPFTLTLAAGQSVLYTATGDLTGSLVSASHPVAVFAGAQCAQVPPGAAFCDHLYSQMLPLERLSLYHVVPGTDRAGGEGNVVRVLAVHGGTSVAVNGAAPVVLGAGQFHEIERAGHLDIISSRPVLVGQYLKGSALTGWGDPAFTVVPGTDQAQREYAYAVPSGAQAFADNVLNIAMPSSAVASLRLDGEPVSASFTPVPGTVYSVGHVAVRPGPGRIRADAPFVATLSGYQWVTSYHTLLGAPHAPGPEEAPSGQGGPGPSLEGMDGGMPASAWWGWLAVAALGWVGLRGRPLVRAPRRG